MTPLHQGEDCGWRRLKKTHAAVVKALEAQSWDDVRAALAHSESSTKRGYARRGMTPEEKKAHNRSMFSEEAYAFCERLHREEVPMTSFHEKNVKSFFEKEQQSDQPK